MKKLLIFVAGAALGSGATYLLMKEYFEQITQEQIDSVVNYKFDKESERMKDNGEFDAVEEIVDIYRGDNDVAPAPILSDKPTKRPPTKKTAYNKPVKPAPKKDIKEIMEERAEGTPMVDQEAEFYDEGPFREVQDEPYVISLDEYVRDRIDHDKIELEYYALDDTLSDEGEIVTEVVHYVGPDALVSFGELSDDDNVVYIRNERLGIDYEIVRIPESYQETVLGIPVEEKPRKKKKVNEE